MKNSTKIARVLVNREEALFYNGFFPIIAVLESEERRTFNVSIRDRKFCIIDSDKVIDEDEISKKFVDFTTVGKLYDEQVWVSFVCNVMHCLDFIINGNLREYHKHFNDKPVTLVGMSPHWTSMGSICYSFV